MPHFFRILAFLLIQLVVYSCSSKKGFIPYEGLKGDPTQVKILDFDPMPENSSQEPTLNSWEIYEFDNVGRKISYQVFRNNGSPVNGGSRFFYLDKGPVQYQENYNLKGETQSRTDFNYDQKGRILKSRTVAGEKETSTKEINYDPKKPISYTKIIYNTKALIQNSVNQMDKKGRVILMTDYHSNGALKGKIRYSFDNKGNDILQEWYNSEDQLFQFFKKTYNKNNDPILNERFEIIAGNPLKTNETPTEYLYDSLGNQSKVTVKADGKAFIKKVEVTYPEKN